MGGGDVVRVTSPGSIASCHFDGSGFLICRTYCNLDYIDYQYSISHPPWRPQHLMPSQPTEARVQGMMEASPSCAPSVGGGCPAHTSQDQRGGGLPTHTPPRPRILRETCLRLRVSKVRDSHRSSPRALSEATGSPQTSRNPGPATGGVPHAPLPSKVLQGDPFAVETSRRKPPLWSLLGQ